MIIKVKLDELKKVMLVKGHTQRSLSDASGVSDTHVNHICRGLRSPGPVTAKKIYTALDCDFESIFFVDDDSKSNQETNTA